MNKKLGWFAIGCMVAGLLMLIGAVIAFLSGEAFNSVMLLAVIGAMFFLIGFVPAVSKYRANKKRDELLRSGRAVEAKIENVNMNMMYSSSGRNPYIITCRWSDALNPDEVYQFRSENIWYDPKSMLTKDTMTVYLDQKNPKRYYMDIRFLPETVNG
ncbi:hypothetical protein [Zophobihabitans entericus]|uniref:DUF3592 domain-containing protein n=1 Tax=Zophobihabitans entericus TaxID=1635327 RepID=A0A6G9I9K1_9GAMM|nr:hypothetical protein [Zophobihabitans entericus]QIQ20896.1 hypothetical protein IPMB12_03880 [Zophobihabitans entericus]